MATFERPKTVPWAAPELIRFSRDLPRSVSALAANHRRLGAFAPAANSLGVGTASRQICQFHLARRLIMCVWLAGLPLY